MAEREGQAGPQGGLHQALDEAARRIATALVIAAGIVSLAIYVRPAPPRFEAIAADGKLFRVDTKTGTVLACVESRCTTVVKRGQHLERSLSIGIERAPPAQPKAQVPAEAPAPTR